MRIQTIGLILVPLLLVTACDKTEPTTAPVPTSTTTAPNAADDTSKEKDGGEAAIGCPLHELSGHPNSPLRIMRCDGDTANDMLAGLAEAHPGLQITPTMYGDYQKGFLVLIPPKHKSKK